MKFYYIIFISKYSYKFFTSMRCVNFFWRILLFGFVNICSMVFKSGLVTGQSFNTITLSPARLCCVARDLRYGAPPCWKLFNFIQVLYQIVLRFGHYSDYHLSWTITFYVYEMHQIHTSKLHCFRRLAGVILLSNKREFGRKPPRKLVKIDGNLNRAKYIQLLKNNLIQDMDEGGIF